MGMESQYNGADAVGQRLSLRIDRIDRPGMVIAYFPRTQKHRVRFDEEQGREKNLRLKDYSVRWIRSDANGNLSSLQLAIRCDAAGRRLEVYNQVRRKWFQGTILKYVKHCQQHTLEIEPQGKVHMIDLTQLDLAWRYTDLVGEQETPETSTLEVSKYRGVQRLTLGCWKALYEPDTLVGCFASEKDAALAYDVYARKRGTPVNFDDRRICRQVMKSLRIPEPEPEQEQALVSEESQTTSSHNHVPVVEKTPDALSVKKANQQEDSDVTSSLAMEETDLETESTSMVSSSSRSNSNDQDQANPSEPPPTKVRRRISVDEEEEDDDNDDNNDKPISAKEAAAQVRAQLQMQAGHEDSEFEFEDDEEDHNGQDEDSDDEEFTSSSSESDQESDSDNVVVRRRKTRGRSQKKKACPENLFEDSEDEEEEASKTKGRKRALQELQSYNAPPKSKSEKPGRRKRNRARWPVGTRFVKEFPEFGTFEGRITEWDGKHYHVYYSEDEDEEELSEREFDNYRILSVPGGNKGKLVAQQKKRKKERKQKRARLV